MYLKDFTTLVFGLNPSYQLYFQNNNSLIPITQFLKNDQATILLTNSASGTAMSLQSFFKLSNQFASPNTEILINYNSQDFKVFGYRISENRLLINGKLRLVE
ncbi:hypothetical protein [Liquorilactobacillus hordei]|uniref:Uncharacterized protein n=1 Tax=Liquorilactobacillus hordei TaxID=468911 RepID=A0A3Q8C9X0_9LACO|nr:hypothetical protein [Liquorilactobacillus hordei]AUJ30111.1 hypothetical protein BSQ49_07780 [Liquorilactobacillus hordei]